MWTSCPIQATASRQLITEVKYCGEQRRVTASRGRPRAQRWSPASSHHFGLLLLQGAEAVPPANDAPLGLHQVHADAVVALLLVGGPEEGRGQRSELLQHSETDGRRR